MALKDEAWRRAPAAYPFRVTLQTRYGDMDSNAHLNNVAIARLFEEARLRFHADLRGGGFAVDPGGLMIAHIGIDYLSEGRYPHDVVAGLAVAAVGNRSFRLAIALFQQGQAFAVAECVMVHRTPPDAATRAALQSKGPLT